MFICAMINVLMLNRQVSSSSSKHLTSSDDDSDLSSYEEKHYK